MDDYRVVLAVEKRSAIYDKKNPRHGNRDALRVIWSEIATELGLGADRVEKVKKRWSYLRDYFTRQYREMRSAKPGEKEARRPTWSLFETMSFLIPHIEEREMQGNFATSQRAADVVATKDRRSEASGADNNLNQDLFAEEDPRTNAKHPQESLLTQRLSATRHNANWHSTDLWSRNTLTTDKITIDLETLAALRQSQELDDDDDHFFKSLKPTIRQLDPVRKLHFWNEVQKLVLHFIQPSTSTSPVRSQENTRNSWHMTETLHDST
ncbi:uncharacterized protein LOC143033768 [Oratosquilla oratoria]|uniref:uncharacterized protein LOC143033768 n=1 Tax=Oratosquilla oratoria TaxID=337810 RepID=UPI003F759A90